MDLLGRRNRTTLVVKAIFYPPETYVNFPIERSTHPFAIGTSPTIDAFSQSVHKGHKMSTIKFC